MLLSRLLLLTVGLLLGAGGCDSLIPFTGGLDAPADRGGSGDVILDGPWAILEGPGFDRSVSRLEGGADRGLDRGLDLGLPVGQAAVTAQHSLAFQVTAGAGVLVVAIGWFGSPAPTLAPPPTSVHFGTTPISTGGHGLSGSLGTGLWRLPLPAARSDTVTVVFPQPVNAVAQGFTLTGVSVIPGGGGNAAKISPAEPIKVTMAFSQCPVFVDVVTVLAHPTTLEPGPGQLLNAPVLGTGSITLGSSWQEPVQDSSVSNWTEPSQARWILWGACFK